ncbi:hypothetical protein [Fibrobacter sp.]|uniref:hypothetical protein n=1 Tax=Fibrobacter sp. TaxID=35828 RepID=UPI00386D4AA2
MRVTQERIKELCWEYFDSYEENTGAEKEELESDLELELDVLRDLRREYEEIRRDRDTLREESGIRPYSTADDGSVIFEGDVINDTDNM